MSTALEAGYILSRAPLTIRQPDVSVLSRERINATDPDSYFEGAPELAIEIVSPSDAAEDLDIKTRQYLLSGARQVWIVYPTTQTVQIFSRSEPAMISIRIASLKEETCSRDLVRRLPRCLPFDGLNGPASRC